MAIDRHAAADPTTEPQLLDIAAQITAIVRGVVPLAGLRDFFDASFRTLPEVIGAQGAMIAGPAFGLYRTPSGEDLELELGFAVDRPIQPDRGVTGDRLPAGRVARLVHIGSFDGLTAAWERLSAWIGEQGLTPESIRWELYLTRPAPDMDPNELRTELNWPIRSA